MPEKFWLYDWIDNCGIRDFTHAERLLKDDVAIADLRERAAAVPYITASLPSSEQHTVVAGCGLDLSGLLSCFHWDCAKEQLDSLFGHVWHYFDRIVVVGPSAFMISSEWEETGKPPIRLATYLRLLLYIREIGADDALVFRQKSPACEVHLEQHLKEVGLDGVLEESNELIFSLSAEAKIQTDQHGNHIHYNFYHPSFVHNVWGQIKTDGVDTDYRSAITKAVVKKHLAALVSDLRAAQSLHCSLGATVGFQARFVDGFPMDAADKIAFQLDLPVVNGIELKTLLKLRQDEKDSFERFRRALQSATADRQGSRHASNHEALAAEIRRDVVEPALADIRIRLQTATRLMTRKAAESLMLGALSTLCGIYANPVMAVGIAPALSGLVNARHKYLDEHREISLSEMYFLWNAGNHN